MRLIKKISRSLGLFLLSISVDNSSFSKTLLTYLRKSFFVNQVHPKSEKWEAKYRFSFLFDVYKSVEDEINASANKYYDNRHPKHFLWTGHNQYLYDNISVGDRVLDIGCSATFYPQWLTEKASYVLGVDINPILVEKSKKLHPNNDKLEFKVMDVTKELPENQFDVAICSHVIEHLDEPVKFLHALSLKVPKIIVKVPLVDTHWMKCVKQDLGIYWFDDPDHRREYTLDLLESQLNEGGWEICQLLRGYDARAVATSKFCKLSN